MASSAAATARDTATTAHNMATSGAATARDVAGRAAGTARDTATTTATTARNVATTGAATARDVVGRAAGTARDTATTAATTARDVAGSAADTARDTAAGAAAAAGDTARGAGEGAAYAAGAAVGAAQVSSSLHMSTMCITCPAGLAYSSGHLCACSAAWHPADLWCHLCGDPFAVPAQLPTLIPTHLHRPWLVAPRWPVLVRSTPPSRPCVGRLPAPRVSLQVIQRDVWCLCAGQEGMRLESAIG